MNIEIRQAAGRKDAELLEKLANSIWREHYAPIIGLDQVEYMLTNFQSADRIAEDMAEKGYTYYIAELDGKPVGYCGVKPEVNGVLFLSKLYVHRDARGRGVAKQILTLLERRCRLEECDKIRLTVNKNNTSSIAAYQKLGFTQADRIVTDIGGGFVMDDYVLIKQI